MQYMIAFWRMAIVRRSIPGPGGGAYWSVGGICGGIWGGICDIGFSDSDVTASAGREKQRRQRHDVSYSRCYHAQRAAQAPPGVRATALVVPCVRIRDLLV
jgi:hypothetical protein